MKILEAFLTWLDRWAFRHTHRLQVTKRPGGYEIHEWKNKERAKWDC